MVPAMARFLCLTTIVLVICFVVKTRQGEWGGGGMLDLDDRSHRLPFDTAGVNAFAVPLALLLGWMLKGVWAVIGFFLFKTPVHELGHSILAWLRGKVCLGMVLAYYARFLWVALNKKPDDSGAAA